MHIEPGIVIGAKIALSYATSAVSLGVAAKMAFDEIKQTKSGAFLVKALIATVLVFSFFEVLPHLPVGVSEVHLILGTTLLLVFGAAAASVGLALGLLAQGVFFAPLDLPQYGMNVTTLLIPLFAAAALSKQIIAKNTPYTEITYSQALKLSVAYQGGVVAWVAFWALYGQGFGAENLSAIASFGASYIAVVAVEPLIDLTVLWAAKKATSPLKNSNLVTSRLYSRQ